MKATLSPVKDLAGPSITLAASTRSSLSAEIQRHQPGDVIRIKTIENDEEKIYDIELDEKEGQPYLGIGIRDIERKGVLGKLYDYVTEIKDPFIYYEPKWNGNFAWFVYNLLWWVVLINLSVALINMLPVGIFDGGRFFYLTILALTKSEKKAEKFFKIVTYLFLLLLFVLIGSWLVSFIR